MGTRFGKGQGDLWQRATVRAGKGLDLASPLDQLADDKHPYLENMRSYTKGGLQPRPGLELLHNLAGVHSIFQLQDNYNNLTPFIYGAGTNLYYDTNLTTPAATGLSGDPISGVVGRPERTPDPWLYIGDQNKMLSLSAAGVVRNWGIAPPVEAPTLLNPDPAKILTISNTDNLTQDGATWNNSVGAGSLSLVNRTNTTITRILYDSGSTGYCLIQPAAMGKDIQPGMRILVNSAEQVLVEQVLPAISSTTVEAIEYDSGSTGLCTIQLTAATAGLQPNSMLYLNSSEAVRVLEVTDGLDSRPCVRVSTAGTIAAGHTVVGLSAFRCYTSGSFSAGQALICKAIQSTIDPTSGTPAGIGNIRLNAARDLTQISGRALTEDDEISLGIYIEDINRLIEFRLWLDVDPGTAAGVYAATDLSRNYYFYAARPSDLQAFADFNTATSLVGATPGRIQKSTYDKFNAGPNALIRDNETGQLLSYDQVLADARALKKAFGPGGGSGTRQELLDKFQQRYGVGIDDNNQPLFQLGSGQEQWYQLTIKVKDLQRVGTDRSLTLKNVTSIMASFQLTQPATPATVDCAISSWWIGGGYGLDSYSSPTVFSDAYYYRYTGWNDATGDESLPSPATRVGVLSRRQQNQIQLAKHPDAQVTKLNIYRYGGTLKQWIYVGQVDNPSGATTTYTDNLPDDSIASNQLMRFNLYAPFATAGRPARGTCRIVGNRMIWLSGDKFDTTWAPGTEVVINGKTHLLYRQPADDQHIELAASAGAGTPLAFYFPSPIRLGKPLSRVFGPYGTGAEALVYFACGDPVNPGYLYWTNENDPNATTDANYIEVTPPNEPLINGCVYDGRVFVFSSERMWQVSATRALDGSLSYQAQEVANSRGLVAPWALCVDKLIYFLSKDGLYASEGGQPTSLTEDTLYELFPHDSLPGEDVNGIPAPDLSQDTYLRLSSLSGMLYFDYLVKNRPSPSTISMATLVLTIQRGAWLYDRYEDDGVRCRYKALGAGAGDYRLVCATANKVGTLTSNRTTDYDAPFTCRWETLAYNAGEFRAEKHWGDHESQFDCDADGDSFSVYTYAKQFSELVQMDSITSQAGRARYRFDLPTDLFRVDLGVRYVYSSPAGNGFVWYTWEPSLLLRPELSTRRTTDWDDCGSPGTKLVQGFILEADTLGQDRPVQVVGDNGEVLATLTINHAGQVAKPYSLSTPGKAHLVRLQPSDTDEWRLYNITWIVTSYPELATVWETAAGDLGYCGWKHVPEIWIDRESTTATVLTVTIDGAARSYQIPSSGGQLLRYYLRLEPTKGKIFKFRLENSAGVRIANTTCVKVGDWGRSFEQGYRTVTPFGGPSGQEEGAVI